MSSAQKRVIVGTAGHINHGKSSLVEALTGTHPDRLEEERRRGITIDLGFVFLEDEHVSFGFVDVPGHERFVKNMLAGAWGMDLLLLVVAADEGIKPQTREHFDICRLLGVRRGVIALTKADRLDGDTLELSRLEIEEFVEGSFLANAPIVEVSAKTGAGLTELKAALTEAADRIPPKNPQHYFRLPIDRSFSVKGFGTVVTGTLAAGSVRAEEEVELLPSGARLRARGVETGGKSVPRAEAGQRTAVNLAAIEHSAIRRGMTLATPGTFRPSRRVDVYLELLPSARPLKHRARVHFHSGTSEGLGKFCCLKELNFCPEKVDSRTSGCRRSGARSGGPLHSPSVFARHDHWRRHGARSTREAACEERYWTCPVPRDRPPRVTGRDSARHDRTKCTGHKDRRDCGSNGLARTGHRELCRSARQKERSPDRFARAVTALFGERFEEICQTPDACRTISQRQPVAAGVAREELRAILGKRVRPETFQGALSQLVGEKKLVVEGDLVKKPGTEVTLTREEAKAKAHMEEAFRKAGLTVPSAKEVLSQLTIDRGDAEKILQILVREKVLVRVSVELVFHEEALRQLLLLVVAYKKSNGERIGVPSFKLLTGVTRKYAIPLLEYLDRQRVTRRAGDERVIL